MVATMMEMFGDQTPNQCFETCSFLLLNDLGTIFLMKLLLTDSLFADFVGEEPRGTLLKPQLG
jgi:hypothetical protein